MDSIVKRLNELEQNLSATVKSEQQSKLSNDEKFERIERKIDLIAAAVCVKDTDRSEEEAEDRKRLKERLKEALENSTQSRDKDPEDEKDSWMEYLFGICKPDGRVGKEGSRYCSSFVRSISAQHISNKTTLLPADSYIRSHASCKVLL